MHPVAILRAVFCTICSLSMFVSPFSYRVGHVLLSILLMLKFFFLQSDNYVETVYFLYISFMLF